METKDLKILEKSIKYKFKDIALLELAMTHRSHSGKNNERLEFLGDSILNFIIAEDLFHRFDDANEGQLHLIGTAVKQKGESIGYEVAGEMGMSQYISLASEVAAINGLDSEGNE